MPVTSYTRLHPTRRVISKFCGMFGIGILYASVTLLLRTEIVAPFPSGPLSASGRSEIAGGGMSQSVVCAEKMCADHE